MSQTTQEYIKSQLSDIEWDDMTQFEQTLCRKMDIWPVGRPGEKALPNQLLDKALDACKYANSLLALCARSGALKEPVTVEIWSEVQQKLSEVLHDAGIFSQRGIFPYDHICPNGD